MEVASTNLSGDDAVFFVFAIVSFKRDHVLPLEQTAAGSLVASVGASGLLPSTCSIRVQELEVRHFPG